ncbi:hypothetical protein [Candidatus Manganitrophus noduliformans]|uniref:Uncharacterized protein n=1 Tax=Candidatus Manganitrophus noduliformans TaxID=2606439 RepID=A0A7X6IAH7_9BACT|nr:hypothetical protein [Candidatus Manganitrophus noduliformans]NKE70721.1 hypothetical protein [Candidatus Manganitrophus noduliformans]
MARVFDLPLSRERRTDSRERRGDPRRGADRTGREDRRVLSSVVRWGFYGLVTAGLFQGFVFASYSVEVKRLFSENGPVEWLQFLLLLTCCGWLQAIAIRSGSQREIFRLGIFFILMVAVREMDANLDRYLFDGAWQLTVMGLIFSGLLYAWPQRRKIATQLRSLLFSRSFGLLLAGLLVLTFFAPFLGQQRFWKAALQENYIRPAARIVEESGELLGYLLLLFGCIEAFFSSPPDRNNEASF